MRTDLDLALPGCQISAGLCGFPFFRNRYLKIDTFRVRMPGADAGPYISMSLQNDLAKNKIISPEKVPAYQSLLA